MAQRQPLVSCTISPSCQKYRNITRTINRHERRMNAPQHFISSTTSGKGREGLEQQSNHRQSVNIPFSSPIFILPLIAKHEQIKGLETVTAFAATANLYLPCSIYICLAQFPLNPFASITHFSMHDKCQQATTRNGPNIKMKEIVQSDRAKCRYPRSIRCFHLTLDTPVHKPVAIRYLAQTLTIFKTTAVKSTTYTTHSRQCQTRLLLQTGNGKRPGAPFLRLSEGSWESRGARRIT